MLFIKILKVTYVKSQALKKLMVSRKEYVFFVLLTISHGLF